MSSARKPVPPDPAIPTRRPPASTNSNPAPKTPSRSAAPSASSDTVQANGLARTPSMRKENVPFSARAAAARRAGNRMSAGFGSTSALSQDGAEDDARAEHAQLVAELKEQLQRAEFASEQYQKQLEVLQLRLDEVLIDQSRLEDQGHQRDAEIQILQANAKDFARQRKEMEQFHEAEKALILKERDQQARKEEELQVVIRRLNDTIRQRDIRFQDASPSGRSSPRLDSETFAPFPPTSQEEPNEENQQLQQKDRMIESLRLELADAEIKLTEMEHMGDGRLQELEKQLLEARMTNARLLEDNESYQLLLSEKTLKGDFTKSEFMGSASNADALSALEGRSLGTSLADELSEAADGESENYRHLEAELKTVKDQNKALTLYINRSE